MRSITTVTASTPYRYDSLTMMALPLKAMAPAAASNNPEKTGREEKVMKDAKPKGKSGVYVRLIKAYVTNAQ